MKVLVTGGAGYLGYSLIERLEQRAEISQIIIYDNLSANSYPFFLTQLNKSQKIKFINGDILDNRKLGESLKGIDTVFHLAAKTSEPDRDIDAHFFEQTNTWGTAVLINEAIKQQVKSIVYASSIYVYGYSEEAAALKDTPSPKSFYGISKWRGEQQLDIGSDISIYNIRIGNIYGVNPCVRFNTIINKLMFEAHYGNTISVFGDGHQVRPFIRVTDAAESLLRPLDSDFSAGTHTAVKHHFSVLEIIEYLKEIYPKLQYVFVNKHIKMGSIRVYIGEENLNIINNVNVFKQELLNIKNNLI